METGSRDWAALRGGEFGSWRQQLRGARVRVAAGWRIHGRCFLVLASHWSPDLRRPQGVLLVAGAQGTSIVDISAASPQAMFSPGVLRLATAVRQPNRLLCNAIQGKRASSANTERAVPQRVAGCRWQQTLAENQTTTQHFLELVRMSNLLHHVHGRWYLKT